MAAKKQIMSLTGYVAIDRLFARLMREVHPKYIKKAARESAKVLMADMRAKTPVDKGVMKRAYQVVAYTKKYKAPTGKIRGTINKQTGHVSLFEVQKIVAYAHGATVTIKRKRLNSLLAKAGRKPLADSAYFYPATVELGNPETPAVMPMRKSARENRRNVLSTYKRHLRAMIATAKAVGGGK